MKKLVLSSLYIVDCDDRVRLCTDVKRDGVCFQLFYEFESDLKQYIDTDVVDPFLVAILPYALEFGFDIICDVPIGDEIYYNIVNDIIPVFVAGQSYFNKIEIVAEKGVINHKVENKGAVGTGVSCGVDSIYTILSHIGSYNSRIPKSHELTHLVLMNAGSCSAKGGEESYKWFCEEVEQAQKVSREIGLNLITIHTNLMEFYGVDHSHSGTMRMAGCILALDKFFDKYYLASGYDIKQFRFANDDAAYAFYTLRYVTTSNILFYLTGNSVNRDMRVEYISDSNIAQNYLNVCWNGAHNCGLCEKCLRTMGSLYSINKLNLYHKCFDVNNFEKNKIRRIAKIIYNSRFHPELYGFLKKIRRRESGLFFGAKLYYIFIIFPFEIAKKLIKKIIHPDSRLYKNLQRLIKK